MALTARQEKQRKRQEDYLIDNHRLGYGKRLSLNGFIESKWHAVAWSKSNSRIKQSSGSRSGRARIISL
jgi:hypothetical protein